MRASMIRNTCFVLLCVAATVASGDEASTLRLGSDVWPPFTDRPGHRRAAIDVVESALGRAKISSQTEIKESWTEVMRGLRDGSLAGSAAVWHSDARSEFLLFSRAYLENRLVLLARKGTDVGAKSLPELRGHRIGIVLEAVSTTPPSSITNASVPSPRSIESGRLNVASQLPRLSTRALPR